jgi:hypothetical protein
MFVEKTETPKGLQMSIEEFTENGFPKLEKVGEKFGDRKVILSLVHLTPTLTSFSNMFFRKLLQEQSERKSKIQNFMQRIRNPEPAEKEREETISGGGGGGGGGKDDNRSASTSRSKPRDVSAGNIIPILYYFNGFYLFLPLFNKQGRSRKPISTSTTAPAAATTRRTNPPHRSSNITSNKISASQSRSQDNNDEKSPRPLPPPPIPESFPLSPPLRNGNRNNSDGKHHHQSKQQQQQISLHEMLEQLPEPGDENYYDFDQFEAIDPSEAPPSYRQFFKQEGEGEEEEKNSKINSARRNIPEAKEDNKEKDLKKEKLSSIRKQTVDRVKQKQREEEMKKK